jgi:hypothetical protein
VNNKTGTSPSAEGLRLLRWILADDRRTARTIRLIACAMVSALSVVAAGLMIVDSGRATTGLTGMALVSASTGFAVGRRRRGQS